MLAQLAASLAQVKAHRALCNVEHRADFGDGHVVEVVEGGNGALAIRQVPEQFERRLTGFPHRVRWWRCTLFATTASGIRPVCITCGVDRDPPDPGADIVVTTHLVPSGVGLDEGLLGRIVGSFGITADERHGLGDRVVVIDEEPLELEFTFVAVAHCEVVETIDGKRVEPQQAGAEGVIHILYT